MHNTITKNSKMFIESINANKNLKDITLGSKIRNSIVMASATLENKPLYLYNKNHKITKDILDIVKELEEKNIF